MECVNFKKRISKKTSGTFVGKIKNYQSGLCTLHVQKNNRISHSRYFYSKIGRFNLDIIIEREDKNFPSANKD